MTTIVLGGVTLNPNMEWIDRFRSQKVAQSLRRTLGGKPVVYSASLSSGIDITLESTEDHGWLEKTVVDQLIVLADATGATYTLSFNSVDYTVMFRHHDAPALDLKPIVHRVAHQTGDYFYGQIKLVTV